MGHKVPAAIFLFIGKMPEAQQQKKSTCLLNLMVDTAPFTHRVLVGTFVGSCQSRSVGTDSQLPLLSARSNTLSYISRRLIICNLFSYHSTQFMRYRSSSHFKALRRPTLYYKDSQFCFEFSAFIITAHRFLNSNTGYKCS